MEKPLEKSKKTKFNYLEFAKWLSIGFTIVSLGVAIAIIMYIFTKL